MATDDTSEFHKAGTGIRRRRNGGPWLQPEWPAWATSSLVGSLGITSAQSTPQPPPPPPLPPHPIYSGPRFTRPATNSGACGSTTSEFASPDPVGCQQSGLISSLSGNPLARRAFFALISFFIVFIFCMSSPFFSNFVTSIPIISRVLAGAQSANLANPS